MEDTNQTSQNQTSAGTQTSAPNQPAGAAPVASMDNKKLYGIIGYIIPILFFLPLIDEKLKTDASARFHANQQLILLIAAIALHFVVSSVLGMVLGPLVYMLGSVINIIFLILAVLGILNVVKGVDAELPVIGKFKLIK